MGGGYYDRDVVSTVSSTGYSDISAKNVGVEKKLHKSLDPKRWSEEVLLCDKLDPIVFALDVTGSMGDWSKIIYDKMPMFYGQIMMQKYLTDPSVSFCAVGDYTCDVAPIQVSEFGQAKEIDQLISKIYLESGGGGGYTESYEFPAYFYLNNVKLENTETPFFFVTGDEAFYDTIPKEQIEHHLGVKCQKSVDSYEIWKNLMLKYNVFLIKKPYSHKKDDKVIYNQWKSAIGEERILSISTPKACIDVVLGAIAITSKTRTLDEYIKDMVERGQTSERVNEVTKALKPYWEKMKSNNISLIKNQKAMSVDELLIKLEYFKNSDLSSEERENLLALKEIQKKQGEEFPEYFICPLTKEPIVDPVMTELGHTFEKYAIKRWFDSGNNHLPNDDKLCGANLIPNVTYKKMINDFIKKNS